MSDATVTTQAELDAALANADVTDIYIKSPAGVWLTLPSSGSATVEASGSATVEAFGSATVRAFDSATVRASGSATVRASGSATVEASGSATVRAFDSATVRASGSATVRAFDSATVRASGSATVEASGSATVRAFGSATVRAFDSATVRASGSATVEASSHVAVHLHSARAQITGGVVIDVTSLDLNDTRTWAGYHGAEVVDGGDQEFVILFKATDPELTAGRDYGKPTVYAPGTEVACDDWRDDDQCGHGLHVSQTPHHAARYRPSGEKSRYLKVSVPLDQVRVIGNDKVKVPALTVLAEVDAFGRPIGGAE